MRRSLSWGSRQGFSLIELITTIGIITLLAALLVPVVSSFRESGRRSSCLAHMREVANIVFRYSTDHGNRILPAASGATDWMNDNLWYELLDAEGYLAANPNNPSNKNADLWSGKRNSIMSCPSRDRAPYSYWANQKHDLHYCLNQNPGFLNRVNTSDGYWPTMAKVTRPSRTFLLAEANFPVAYPNGDKLVYPHPRNGKKETEGGGMNLVFFDGHVEYFKGRLPVIGGEDFTKLPYESMSPEESYPWF